MRFRQAQKVPHFFKNVKPVSYKTRSKPLMIPKVFTFSKLTIAIFNFWQSKKLVACVVPLHLIQIRVLILSPLMNLLYLKRACLFAGLTRLRDFVIACFSALVLTYLRA